MKKKRISGEAYDINKQTIGLYKYSAEIKTQLRAHYASEPGRDGESRNAIPDDVF